MAHYTTTHALQHLCSLRRHEQQRKMLEESTSEWQGITVSQCDSRTRNHMITTLSTDNMLSAATVQTMAHSQPHGMAWQPHWQPPVLLWSRDGITQRNLAAGAHF